MNENERGKIFRNGLKAAAGVVLASAGLTGAVLTGAENNNNTYGDKITTKDIIIESPEDYEISKTFEAWDYPCGKVGRHWDHSSKQYEFWEKAGGLTSYDENGIAFVNGSYVVAVTSTFGNIGDFFLVKLKDGTIIPFVIGDHKAKADEVCNENGNNDIDLTFKDIDITFMVKTSEWYNKEYKDIAALKPEWYGKAVDDVITTNVNYFEHPEYVISVDEHIEIPYGNGKGEEDR